PGKLPQRGDNGIVDEDGHPPSGAPVMSSLLRPGRRFATRCLARRLERLENRLAPAVATWDGGGADNRWTTAANWAGDIAPNAGDDLVFPAVAAKLTTINDFPAGTAVGSLRIAMVDYRLSGNAIALAGGMVFPPPAATDPTGVPIVGLPITLTADQMFKSPSSGQYS